MKLFKSIFILTILTVLIVSCNSDKNKSEIDSKSTPSPSAGIIKFDSLDPWISEQLSVASMKDAKLDYTILKDELKMPEIAQFKENTDNNTLSFAKTKMKCKPIVRRSGIGGFEVGGVEFTTKDGKVIKAGTLKLSKTQLEGITSKVIILDRVQNFCCEQLAILYEQNPLNHTQIDKVNSMYIQALIEVSKMPSEVMGIPATQTSGK
jgi:hypothetical protein